MAKQAGCSLQIGCAQGVNLSHLIISTRMMNWTMIPPNVTCQELDNCHPVQYTYMRGAGPDFGSYQRLLAGIPPSFFRTPYLLILLTLEPGLKRPHIGIIVCRGNRHCMCHWRSIPSIPLHHSVSSQSILHNSANIARSSECFHFLVHSDGPHGSIADSRADAHNVPRQNELSNVHCIWNKSKSNNNRMMVVVVRVWCGCW